MIPEASTNGRCTEHVVTADPRPQHDCTCCKATGPSCAIGGAQSLKSLSDNCFIDFEQSAYDVRVEKASASSPARCCLSSQAVEHWFLSMAITEIIIFSLVVSECLPSSLMF